MSSIYKLTIYVAYLHTSTVRSVWTLVSLVAWRLALENYHLPKETDTVWGEPNPCLYLPEVIRLRGHGRHHGETACCVQWHTACSESTHWKHSSNRCCYIRCSFRSPLQQFIVIELAKKFPEFVIYSSHHRVYKSLPLGQFSLRNSLMLFYYLALLKEIRNHVPIVRSPVSHFLGVMFVSQLGLKFSVFFSLLPGKLQYTECPGGNVPDFGRMFLTLKYTDITQNTYVYPKLNGYGYNGKRSLEVWQLLHIYWLTNTY